MSDIRNAAQVRQFTLYTVDPPLILAVLSTSRTSQPESWDALVAFLTDSSVPVEVKASTFELLAERIQTMPPPVLPALGPTALEILSNDRVEPSMFGSPVAARGAVLRFALAAGIVSNSDALTQLLGLASDPDPRGRIEAADSLKRAIGVKPDLAVITLAVSLTQDQHHQVRAAAGRALAELSWVNAGPLRGVVRERIRALLTEKGAAVPRATAEGIFQAAKTGTSPDPAVLVTLRAIARNHVAASVRIASSRALEEIG